MIIYNDRIYLPQRDVSVTLGAKVNYFSKEKVATVELDITKIELLIKMNKAVIIKADLSDEKVAVAFIDKDNPKVATLLCDNKAYVPIRFISEAFGFTVTYLDREKEIHFSSLDRVEVPYDGTNNFDTIKPVKKEDVVKGWVDIDGKLVEIEYVENEILFFVNRGITFYEVKTMLEKYDGIIVGYLSDLDLFQIEFKECTYDQLSKKMKEIQQEDIVMEDGVYLNTIARHTPQDTTYDTTPNVLPNDES